MASAGFQNTMVSSTEAQQTSRVDAVAVDTMKTAIAHATQVVCVAYTNEFSVNNDSLNDLQIGVAHGIVSSNQTVLKKARVGSLVVVTSQSGHCVVGILGDHLDRVCNVWANNGGHVFKHARHFTPITDVFLRAPVMTAWAAACDARGVAKKPYNVFNSRLCGYGTWYVPALQAVIEDGIIPVRKSVHGTRVVFE
jgi:hypothetical protein